MIKKMILAELKTYSSEPTQYNKGYVMGLILMARTALVITTEEYAYFMEQVSKISKVSSK